MEQIQKKLESLPNPYLPEEVMVDIFCRLPANSAGRCRCLSKQWQYLLSQPDFTKTHLNQTINHPGQTLLLTTERHNFLCSPLFNDAHQLFDEITIPATKLSFAGHPDSLFYYHGSCNGLVLAIDQDENMFVLNPITRQIRQVCDSPFVLPPEGTIEMYGFGYDSVNDDYMVVILSVYDTGNGVGNHRPHEMLVSVYSMNNDTWEKVLFMLGQEEIFLITKALWKTFMRYNLKQRTFKEVVFHGVFHGVPDIIFDHESFVESLISPHTLLKKG